MTENENKDDNSTKCPKGHKLDRSGVCCLSGQLSPYTKQCCLSGTTPLSEGYCSRKTTLSFPLLNQKDVDAADPYEKVETGAFFTKKAFVKRIRRQQIRRQLEALTYKPVLGPYPTAHQVGLTPYKLETVFSEDDPTQVDWKISDYRVDSLQKNFGLGKAGRFRWLGISPTVRGVAMNPVDHPHGGGERGTSHSTIQLLQDITKAHLENFLDWRSKLHPEAHALFKMIIQHVYLKPYQEFPKKIVERMLVVMPYLAKIHGIDADDVIMRLCPGQLRKITRDIVNRFYVENKAQIEALPIDELFTIRGKIRLPEIEYAKRFDSKRTLDQFGPAYDVAGDNVGILLRGTKRLAQQRYIRPTCMCSMCIQRRQKIRRRVLKTWSRRSMIVPEMATHNKRLNVPLLKQVIFKPRSLKKGPFVDLKLMKRFRLMAADKIYGGQATMAGSIIVRQRGTKFHPGKRGQAYQRKVDICPSPSLYNTKSGKCCVYPQDAYAICCDPGLQIGSSFCCKKGQIVSNGVCCDPGTTGNPWSLTQCCKKGTSANQAVCCPPGHQGDWGIGCCPLRSLGNGDTDTCCRAGYGINGTTGACEAPQT